MKYQFKIKKENKRRLLILLSIIIITTCFWLFALNFTGLFFKIPIETEIKISPINQIDDNYILAIGEESTITFSFIPKYYLNANASLILPEGLEYLKGDLNWQGFLNTNEKKELKASVRAVKVGEWIIKGQLNGFLLNNETWFKICIGVNYEEAKNLCR